MFYYDIFRDNIWVGVIVYSDNVFIIVGFNSYKDLVFFKCVVGVLFCVNGGNRKDKVFIIVRRFFKIKWL